MDRRRTRFLPLIALAGLSGCVGVVEGTRDTPDSRLDEWQCADTSRVTVGEAPMRRLTNVEYMNTVRDLFGAPLPELPSQPDDAVRAGAFENEARALGPSDVRVSRWETSAMRLGELASTNTAVRARIVPCTEAQADCARRFVETFGSRVLRRPLTSDEIERYRAYFEAKRAEIDFAAAVQLTIAAFLQSPSFLYRIEVPTGPERDGGVVLDGYEVASRLSYFLWESMPDDALFDAAASDTLRTDDQIRAQAERMLADERANATIRHFHQQWLHFDRVLGEDKIPAEFPLWSDAVRVSAVEESERFVDAVVSSGGTLTDLLTSRVGFVDRDLAPLYGVSAPPAGTWNEVELPPERAGILSRVAFLAGNSHEGNGSPPLRGVHVLTRLLCSPPGAPPANADTSNPEPNPNEGPVTNRTLFERRTAQPACQACHRRIDPIGYSFEHFDAAGVYRELDNGLPVDASSMLTQTDVDGFVNGSAELQARLSESERVHRCAATQWQAYAYGRATTDEETCHAERLQRRFIDSGGDIRDLLVAIVTAPEFRRAPAIEE